MIRSNKLQEIEQKQFYLSYSGHIAMDITNDMSVAEFSNIWAIFTHQKQQEDEDRKKALAEAQKARRR